MTEPTGFCPHCELTGMVGEPCSERACSLKEAHFIPMEFFELVHSISPVERDPKLGRYVDNYLIVKKLGEGGFGTVYLVLKKNIGLKGALKLISHPVDDPRTMVKLVEKFKGEGASLAQLAHPNIVRLLDYGTITGNKPFLVMEYVENGRSLKEEVMQLVLENRGFEIGVIRHILHQILNALSSAHAKQIIHRDIKPDNIMLQDVSGDRYFVRVLDFGLAKITVDTNTTSMIIGTPVYMSPEQVSMKNIGPWTDLYAVGIIAFELITGRCPYFGDTSNEIYSRKLDPNYNPIAEFKGPELSTPMATFFRKATARDVSDRFQSAAEFGDALDLLLDEIAINQAIAPAADLRNLLSDSERIMLSHHRRELGIPKITPQEQQQEVSGFDETQAADPSQISLGASALESATDEQPTAYVGPNQKPPGAARQPETPVSADALRGIAPPKSTKESLANASSASSGKKHGLAIAVAATILLLIVGVAWTLTKPWSSSGSLTDGMSAPSPGDHTRPPDQIPLQPPTKLSVKKIQPQIPGPTPMPAPQPPVDPRNLRPGDPNTVTFFIISEPKNAMVYRNKHKIGPTPLRVAVPKDKNRSIFELRKRGYKSYTMVLPHDGQVTHKVLLVRTGRRRHKKTRKKDGDSLNKTIRKYQKRYNIKLPF